MSPESLITVFGLAVAVFALLPEERVLDLRIRLRLIDWTIGAVALLLVHYILFYPVLESTGLYIPLGPWRWGFTPETTTYAILLTATMFLWTRARRASMSRRTVPLFALLVDDLVSRRNFPHLLFLLERNFSALERAYSNDYAIERLRGWLQPRRNPFAALNGEAFLDRPIPFASLRYVLARVIPDFSSSTEAARMVAARLMRDAGFTKFVATSCPYFGLRILRSSMEERLEFQLLWLRALIRDRSSSLNVEIRNNENLLRGRRYAFPEENKILAYYFMHAKNAEDLRLGQALDDYFHRRLTKLHRLGDLDPFNQPRDGSVHQRFCENDLESVLQLFEFMITEGLFQNVSWHMDVFSLSSFASRILKNMAPVADVDLEVEWPTAYHRLLYRIVDILVTVLSASAEVPPDQPNRRIDSMTVAHENNNIPKSAILVLGSVVHDVVTANALEDRFKRYLLAITLRFIDEYRRGRTIDDVVELLMDSIACGGVRWTNRVTYAARLRECLQAIDPVRFADICQEISNRAAP